MYAPGMMDQAAVLVNVNNFVRAESDQYFSKAVRDGGFGRFTHRRAMVAIDQQDVVRMNRDTIYSSAVFDLDAGPVIVTLPDTGRRFMSMMVLSQDHYVSDVAYAPAVRTYGRGGVGTRYMLLAIRTLADPNDEKDLRAANTLQDAITAEQEHEGNFEVPLWDTESLSRVRNALKTLGSFGGLEVVFGSKDEVNPIHHLIGAAVGWGGNPRHAAIYKSVVPKRNDGRTVHTLNVRDVPVDSFWSVSVYNERGFFEPNDYNLYSVNNLTARPDPDGSITIRFGACQKDTPNCIPIMPGWNYTVRLYKPRKEILNGRWTFPEALPVK